MHDEDRPARAATVFFVVAVAIVGVFGLACGGESESDSEEPTTRDFCERKCEVVDQPDPETPEEDRSPCVGQQPPDDCVDRCVEHAESFADESDNCFECVRGATGWWGERTVRKTFGDLNIKSSCKHVLYRGSQTSSSSDIDFSKCVPSSSCEGFVFPEPGDGTWCGPRCGYELTTVVDAGTNDAGTNDAGTDDAGTSDAATDDAATDDAASSDASGSDATGDADAADATSSGDLGDFDMD